MDNHSSHTKEITILAVSLFLLWIFAGSLPGLHLDEAWIILRTKEIAEGLRPISGMALYTGALHQYLLWPLFETFGYRVEVLRTASAFLNTFALLFAMLAVRQLHPGKKYHTEVGLLLCTFPAFISSSRFGIEVTALNPLLLFAGLFFIIKAIQTSSLAKARLAALGGICFGLAAYNHLVAITFGLALALSFLIIFKKDCLRRITGSAILGFFLGFSPRFMQIFYPNQSSQPTLSSTFKLEEPLSSFIGLGFIKDFFSLPQILTGVWDGSLIYKRYVGQVLLWVIPYTTLALVVFAGYSVWTQTKLSRLDKAVLLFIGLLLVLTLVITPQLSLRYLEMPVLFVPYLLIRLAAPLREQKTRWIRKFANGFLVGVLVLNCLYLSVNYYINFTRTAGTPSVFRLGYRITETSNHFVRTDKLYNQLIDQQIEVVLGQNFIVAPLQVYDLEKQALKLQPWESDTPLPSNRAAVKKKTAVVYYNGVSPSWTGQLLDFRGRQRLVSGSVEYRFAANFDPHFLVFIAEP